MFQGLGDVAFRDVVAWSLKFRCLLGFRGLGVWLQDWGVGAEASRHTEEQPLLQDRTFAPSGIAKCR